MFLQTEDENLAVSIFTQLHEQLLKLSVSEQSSILQLSCAEVLKQNTVKLLEDPDNVLGMLSLAYVFVKNTLINNYKNTAFLYSTVLLFVLFQCALQIIMIVSTTFICSR